MRVNKKTTIQLWMTLPAPDSLERLTHADLISVVRDLIGGVTRMTERSPSRPTSQKLRKSADASTLAAGVTSGRWPVRPTSRHP
jgi:hypothetical protein